jgi:hypothetical protein
MSIACVVIRCHSEMRRDALTVAEIAVVIVTDAGGLRRRRS